MRLTEVWHYYADDPRKTIPASIRNVRGKGSHWRKTKRLLANKFCNCVKKLEGRMVGTRAIGICTRSVYNNKGLRRVGAFTCKPNRVNFVRARGRRTQRRVRP